MMISELLIISICDQKWQQYIMNKWWAHYLNCEQLKKSYYLPNIYRMQSTVLSALPLKHHKQLYEVDKMIIHLVYNEKLSCRLHSSWMVEPGPNPDSLAPESAHQAMLPNDSSLA